MRLHTLRFGELEIEEDKIVTFPSGVPGFESYRSFIMLTPDEDLPLSFMQSVEEGDLSFIMANPFLFFPDYDFELSEAVQQELGISSENDVSLFTIVSINDRDEVSLNLLAPIVVNRRVKLGKQVILHSSEYRTKHIVDFNKSAKSQRAGDSEVGEGSAC